MKRRIRTTAARPPRLGDLRVPAATARAAMDDHIFRLRGALGTIDTAHVVAVAERLWQVARNGGLVLIAGNGGSAANAAHMAVDLGKSSLGRPPRAAAVRVRAVALSDAASVLTAWGNDEAYERVFAEQVTTLGREGDAVLLLSVSGTSPNIVAAARAARSAGAVVIALLGGDGGAVRALADLGIVVPSDDYQVVEDAHLAINHMITTYLRLAFGAKVPLLNVGGPAPAHPALRKAARRRKHRSTG
jgi:D-sedoheptulose 7-phosphate isomerase